jgi:hypothetical protein
MVNMSFSKKNKIIQVIGLFLILLSCNNKSTPQTTEPKVNYDIVFTEYKNHYTDDTLLTRVEENIIDMSLNSNKREYIYTYNDNRELLLLEEYGIQPDGSKELYSQEIFSKHKKEYFSLAGNDTITSEQSYRDERGNEIEFVYKNRFITNVYFRTVSKYDDNNKLIESIREDYIDKNTITRTFLYEERPDSLIKKIYINGELEVSLYTVQLDKNHTIDYHYDSNNSLTDKFETYQTAGQKTEISTRYDVENGQPNVIRSTDTIKYLHGKEIECIMVLGSQRIKIISEYDNIGNIVRKKEEIRLVEE